MPVANPLYNPEWEKIHDHHNAERERIQQAINSLREESERARSWSDEAVIHQMEELERQYDEHDQACKDSFKM